MMALPAPPVIVSVIAASLRADPVYVSDAEDRAVTGADLTRMAATARSLGVPTYVVVTPLFGRDSPVPDAPTMISLLHSELDRPGAYVVISGSGSIDAQSFDVPLDAADAAQAADFESDFDTSPAAELATFATIARSGHAAARAQADSDDFDAIEKAKDKRFKALEAKEDGDPADRTRGLIALVVGLVTLLALLTTRQGPTVVAAVADGRRRRAAAAPPERPRVASGSDVAQLRRDAQRATDRLHETLQRLPGSASGASRDRAFDSYAAASRLLGEEWGERHRSNVEPGCAAIAAIVLARQGEQAASAATGPGGSAAVTPPCFFNPLHGDVDTDVEWQQGRHTPTARARVPACARCARDVAAGRHPDALTLGGDGPRAVGRPWFDLPSIDPLWARTGFGSLRDDVAAEVLAGGRTVS